MQSLEEFVKESDKYDKRLELLERWIVRKEQEIRERDKIPSKKYHKTDFQKFSELEKKAKIRRIKTLETVARKKYEEISRENLTGIIEKLCKRFYLFNGDYPVFVIDLVKELREHPNITMTDKQVFYLRENKIDVGNILRNI